MKTYICLWQYLTELFSEWEMFQTKVVQKIKTQTLCSWTFFQKLCHLWKNAEKCGRAAEATCMCIACWITKVTDIYSEYVILFTVPKQQWLCKSSTVLTFIHSVPVLLLSWTQEQYSEYYVATLLFCYTLSCTVTE